MVRFTRTELETWGVGQLNELLSELEWRVQHHSETLIAELALRDELEFEKELKNTFISLLLNVQNKRRQTMAAAASQQKKPSPATTPTGRNGNKTLPGIHNSEAKVYTLMMTILSLSFPFMTRRRRSNFSPHFLKPCHLFFRTQYITTVIPYHPGNGPPSNQALQVLIKSKSSLSNEKKTIFFKLFFSCVIHSVLRAIVEDSPTVPTLLTDYILKGTLTAPEQILIFPRKNWLIFHFFFFFRSVVPHVIYRLYIILIVYIVWWTKKSWALMYTLQNDIFCLIPSLSLLDKEFHSPLNHHKPFLLCLALIRNSGSTLHANLIILTRLPFCLRVLIVCE